MAGTWMRLAHASLSSAGDTINTGDFTPKERLKIIAHLPSDGVLDNCKLFAGTGGSIDTGANYAFRHSTNGGGDSTNGSISGYWFTVTTLDGDVMLDADISNKADKEKLIQSRALMAPNGAGTAPQRNEIVGKWVNTSGQINTIRLTNSGSGDFEAGSYITVWGASDDVVTDEKDALTNVEAGTRYEEIDTRKIYRRVVSETLWSETGTGSMGFQTVKQSGWQGDNGIIVPSSMAGKKVKTVAVKMWSQNSAQSPAGTFSCHIYNGTTLKAQSDTFSSASLNVGSNLYASGFNSITFTFASPSYALVTGDYIVIASDTTRSGGGYAQIVGIAHQGSGTNRYYRTSAGSGSFSNSTDGTVDMVISTADGWIERGTA